MNLVQAKMAGHNKVYFTFDCIGDTILLISALKYFYKQTQRKILIGTSYTELAENCPYIDTLDDFCEDNFCVESYENLLAHGIKPIFISATDFVEEDGRLRPVWGKHHILANVCAKLGIDGPVSLVPKLFLTSEEKNRGRFFESSQIAVVAAGNQKYKAIPLDTIQTVVNNLKNRYNFVQVGCISDPLLKGVLDKREWGGLRGTASVLYQSDLFVGGIGGLMHMARAVDTRSVITYSAAEPPHLAKYACNIDVFAPEPKCSMCGDNRSFPYLTNCINQYSCIMGVRPCDIEEAIHLQMGRRTEIPETEILRIKPCAVAGIEDYLKRFGKIPGGK